MKAGTRLVLEHLRDAADRRSSGESLSTRLGVSRAQIWKHMETLRSLGYEISGEAGDGYRLASVPDRLYPEEIQHGLRTRWLARDLHHLESTDSTNRVATDLARDGAPHGTTVVAEAQTAGRGRLGRSFFSPAHLNLYTSIVLRPQLTTAEAPTLILTSAVAVAEAVAEAVGDPSAVEIKWPNDVLLGGKKTSGILMEMNAEATRVAFLVLGIGINLNVPREDFPEEFAALTTSLASHLGRPVDRAGFTRLLYGTLEEVLDAHAEGGFEAVRPRFERWFRMESRRVRVVESGESVIEGIVQGVEPDGALRLLRDDGTSRVVVAGDVSLSKEKIERP